MEYIQYIGDYVGNYIDIPTCLLILSEILPFIQSIKGNGILDILKNFVVKSTPNPVPPTVEVNLQSNTNKGKLSIEWGSD
jgi:hypothetical protein